MNRQAWSGKGRILPWFWDWLAERQMAALTRHARRAPLSRWSRICRWQIGMCTGWSVWLWAFGMIAYVLVLERFFFSNLKGTVNGNPPSTFLFTFMAAIMPVIGAMGRWIVRCRSLGRELMLPVDRVAYVRQLGLAAATSQFQLWCGIVVAAILWWQTLATQPPRLDAVAMMLAVSALCQFWTFGLFAWFARYRSQGLYVLGMMSAIMPAQMLAGFSQWVADVSLGVAGGGHDGRARPADRLGRLSPLAEDGFRLTAGLAQFLIWTMPATKRIMVIRKNRLSSLPRICSFAARKSGMQLEIGNS